MSHPDPSPPGLTPAPQRPFRGDEETMGSTRTRHHSPHPDPRQAAVSMGPPQILTEIAVGSCKGRKANQMPAGTGWRKAPRETSPATEGSVSWDTEPWGHGIPRAPGGRSRRKFATPTGARTGAAPPASGPPNHRDLRPSRTGYRARPRAAGQKGTVLSLLLGAQPRKAGGGPPVSSPLSPASPSLVCSPPRPTPCSQRLLLGSECPHPPQNNLPSSHTYQALCRGNG